MRKPSRWLFGVTAGLAFLFAPDIAIGQEASIPTFGPLKTEECGALAGCEAWMNFRMKHPAPYQAVAIMTDPDQAAATVVLSEPPPTISSTELEAAVRATFGDRLQSIERVRMRTGLDGWLSDLIFRVKLSPGGSTDVVSGETLAPWSVPADLADDLWGLSALIHGTTDGFWIDNIAAPSPKVRVSDLKLAPQFLMDRFADGSADWTPLDDNAAPVTTRTLKNVSKPAAYQRDDGLIVLALPQRVGLADTEVPFRRFAVASDLLLGAVRARSGALLLVGRARALPLSVLPPLRWETFAMLARNTDEELYQSYERRRIFAGKIQDGPHKTWDWAPILLSPQLDDTELGTLLNQADQILKSWSQHGDVRYFSFEQYPAPDAYPFGEQAASDVFEEKQGALSLVFNWNTEDFGLIVSSNNLEATSVDHTGVLPILYLPGNSILESAGLIDAGDLRSAGKEQAARARDVFASQGDPILARVAQNILLGQAVRNMLKVADPPASKGEARSDRTSVVLDREASAWLTRVLQGTEQIDPQARAILLDAQRSSSLPAAKFANFVAVPQRIEQESLRLGARIRSVAGKGQAATDALNKAKADYKAQSLPLGKKACGDSGGKVFGSECKWTGTKEGLAASEKDFDARLTRYLAPPKANIDAAQQLIDAAEKQILPLLSQQNGMIKLANSFERLGAVLGQADDTARLDRILPVVLAANQSKPSAGWIQTPSVVLSKNGKDVEAIGGHNARLTLSRASLRPDRGLVYSEVNGEKLAKGAERVVDPPSPAPEQPVELGAGDGKLFSLLQGRRPAQALQQDLVARLIRESEACPACDRVYFREGETIFEVGTRPPPPKVTQLPGKTVMAGRISEAARGNQSVTTQFVNFPPTVIADTKMLVNRLRQPPGGRSLGELPVVQPDSPAGHVVAVVNPKRKVETLLVDGPADLRVTLARDPIRTNGAQAETLSAEALRAEFGEAAANADAAVVVTFGGPAQPGPRLAITASGAGEKSSLPARLIAAVRAWLPGRPVAPLAQHLIDLRGTLREKLGSARYEFFVTESGGVATIVAIETGAQQG